MPSASPAPRWLVLILLSGSMIALAFLLVFLRAGAGSGAAAGSAGIIPAPQVELASPGPEDAADSPPESQDAGVTAATPEPGGEERELAQSQPPLSRPSRLASLKGQFVPNVHGARILVGRSGVMPLDSAAASWPAGLDDEPGAPVRELRAGPDGSFALSGLEPGRLRLAVRAEGCAPLDRDDLWLMPGEVLDLGEIALSSGMRLSGRVVGPSGEAIPDAALYRVSDRIAGPWQALGPSSASPLGAVDERSGSFSVSECPPGPLRLLVAAPGRPVVAFDGHSTADPLDPSNLRIELEQGERLFGEVIDIDGVVSEGHVVGGVSLRAPLVAFEEARAAGIPPQALAGWRTTLTDATRRFELGGLSDGEAVALRLMSEEPFDVTDAFAPSVLAEAGDRGVELSWRASAQLAFEVVDLSSARGIDGFLARLEGVSPRAPRGRRSSTSAASWSNLRPFAAATDPLYEDLPESSGLTLAIEADGYQLLESPSFRLRSGDSTDLGRLSLAPLLPVFVRVLDGGSGKPLAGAECELAAILPELALGRTSSRARSDRDGRARLNALASAAELVVASAGHAPWRGLAPAPNLAEAPFEVRLVPGARLRVLVLDENRRPLRAEVFRRKSGAEVGSSMEARYERVLADAEGLAEFADLEAGLWTVAARELARADLDLPADPGGLSWVSAGAGQGGSAQVEVSAARTLDLGLRLAFGRKPLEHALVRLAPGREGFSNPHADEARLAPTVVARADENGQCSFADLPAGFYSLRVEHPGIPGFGRAVVVLEPRWRYADLDLAAASISGRLVDEDGEPVNGWIALHAHQGAWFEGMEVEEGASLHSIAPQPIRFKSARTEEGAFLLEGVPPGIELVLTGTAGERWGEYFVEPLELGEQRRDLVLHVAPAATFEARARIEQQPAPMRLGVIGLCLDQPWGRGVVASPMKRHDLELAGRPPGLWHVRLVELAGDHIITRLGPWTEVESSSMPVALSFSER